MSVLELQESILNSLQNLKSLDALKKLFWSQLNYERVNKELSRRKLTDVVANELTDDPLLLASGGANNAFHVIYARLSSEELSRQSERRVIDYLLKEHPYALFVFSNKLRSQWHFINVKYDNTLQKRKLFRRITVGEGEQLRTATERISLLDLENIHPNASPLDIQTRHDEAFDVEAVTQEFFREYRKTFEKVEGLMELVGVPLGKYVNGQIYYGIKTGFNKAFVIDGAKKAELIAQDPQNIEIIKPLAVGDDIRKWQINYKDKWFIYSPWDLKIDKYPAVKNHLNQWYKELISRPECQNGRYNWWCMARYGAEYIDAFYQPKIIYPVIAKESRFAFDLAGALTNDKAFIIPVPELYLLGILNSSTVWEYLKSMCSELLGKSLELRSIYMNKIPIPNASPTEREAISQLVQKCLDAKGVNCEIWEKEIDERVAALYGL